MIEKYKKVLTYVVYTLIVVGIFTLLAWLGRFDSFRNFMEKIELSSFDLRQSIVSKYKKPNKDIVIIAIDDATYEYIMDKYGSWPISRGIWADAINFEYKINPANAIVVVSQDI